MVRVAIPDEVVRRLEAIAGETGASSVVEVVRNALAVYELLVREREAGRRLVLAPSPGQVGPGSELREVELSPGGASNVIPFRTQRSE